MLKQGEYKMVQNCLNCGEILFDKVRLDDVHWAMSSSTHRELESNGTDSFFRCPHCNAKNVVIISTNERGVSQFIVSHIKE